jgi:GNAT superfamily N-acetyltransferase
VRTLTPAEQLALLHVIPPERPGPLVVEQIVAAGVGRVRVDRWPGPRAVVAELPGENIALRGDPAAVPPAVLAELSGLVDAGPEWLPYLGEGVAVWDRVVGLLPADAQVDASPARLLGPGDAPELAALHPGAAWICETWGGPDGLAAAGVARGLFDGERLVAVATPFFVGRRFTDIGVVTDADHRGRGLSTACAAAVVADVRAQGRIPTWTTSPDNAASRAVAAKLGFVHVRDDVLYAVRVPIPA